MRSLGHPSKSKLEDWLSGVDLPKVGNHLSTCTRCMELMEELSNVADTDPNIANHLVSLLAPPDDLAKRIEQKVAARFDSQMLDVAADLFGAGLETSRILIMEEPNE